jgi:hypothetical protein
MQRNVLKILFMMIMISCSSTVQKIYWTGELVDRSKDINYLYWNDGNQFITQQKDSITVSIAGFAVDNAVYFLASMTNNTGSAFTFFTKGCQLNYNYNKENIYLKPVHPKNLDKQHFSFFNTIVGGAGNISRLFLPIPVDILSVTKKEDSNAPDKFSAEYHDEDINMSKKIFMDNHTLFPGTNYAGFLVFEYDEDKSIKEYIFSLEINLGSGFKVQGSFKK